MIQTAQLILSLSILVLLHEFGHFLPAKLFKTRVEKFYLFFNPWFSVFKKKIGETEYGLGWLPLGGYVKIAGMIDESMDTKQMALPPQPWEFRSKPAWQRLVMMLGGIVVNIILAFIIFSGIFAFYGEEYLPITSLNQGVYADPILRKIGFENGDKIIKLDEKTVTSNMALQDVSWAILMKEAKTVTVQRGATTKVVTIPEDIDTKLLANKTPVLFEVPVPFICDSVVPGQNAYLAGLKPYDRIVAVNRVSTASFYHVKELLLNNAGKDVLLTVQRNDITTRIKTHVSKSGTLGIMAGLAGFNGYEFSTKRYGFAGSIAKGAAFTVEIFGKNVSQLKLLFNQNGTKHVGSILAMRKQFPAAWDWRVFWMLTANLSLVLAFFNLLPIPGLDGGHALFTIYEMVTRQKPSQKFMEVTQSVGVVLLLSLMFFAFGNDIFNGNY
jgi:regulator of sigma E protease